MVNKTEENFMKLLLILGMALLAGCSNQAAKDYYSAVQTTATAQANAAAARYEALAKMSAEGSSESQTAAVMALALFNPVIVQPQYVEDTGLKWATVLAGPVAAVAGVYINSQQAVDLAKINQRTQIAGIDAQSAQQTAAYAAIGQSSQGSAEVVSGLVDITGTALELVSSTNEQAFDFSGEIVDTSYNFASEFSDGVLDFSTLLVETYDPIVIVPIAPPVLGATP